MVHCKKNTQMSNTSIFSNVLAYYSIVKEILQGEGQYIYMQSIFPTKFYPCS